MGRYAFFSTGYEYKFAFAVQPSEDILTFGGSQRLRRDDEEDEDMGNVRWTREEDLAYIHTKLTTDFDFPLPPVHAYEKTLKGLYAFRQDLKLDTNRWNEGDYATKFSRFLLGALIYFQLHMEPTLSVRFEY
jgi:hypothetical protein